MGVDVPDGVALAEAPEDHRLDEVERLPHDVAGVGASEAHGLEEGREKGTGPAQEREHDAWNSVNGDTGRMAAVSSRATRSAADSTSPVEAFRSATGITSTPAARTAAISRWMKVCEASG